MHLLFFSSSSPRFSFMLQQHGNLYFLVWHVPGVLYVSWLQKIRSHLCHAWKGHCVPDQHRENLCICLLLPFLNWKRKTFAPLEWWVTFKTDLSSIKTRRALIISQARWHSNGWEGKSFPMQKSIDGSTGVSAKSAFIVYMVLCVLLKYLCVPGCD